MAFKDFEKVVANALSAKGLAVGNVAPDFSLPNAIGETIQLSEVLNQSPVILKFYRGEWCPLCHVDLHKLQQVLPQIKTLGATLIAISPQKPNDALTIQEKNDLTYEVLSDAYQEVIKAYNIQFHPGPEYLNRRDLTLLNGDGSEYLPVPATFIIDKNRVIQTAHIEADYTQRMSPEAVLKALEKLK